MAFGRREAHFGRVTLQNVGHRTRLLLLFVSLNLKNDIVIVKNLSMLQGYVHTVIRLFKETLMLCNP